MFTEAGAVLSGTRAPVSGVPWAAGLYPHRAAPALRLRAARFAGGDNPIPPDARIPDPGPAAFARRIRRETSQEGVKDAAFLTWKSGKEPYFFASRVRPTYRKSTSLTPAAAATAAKALLA